MSVSSSPSAHGNAPMPPPWLLASLQDGVVESSAVRGLLDSCEGLKVVEDEFNQALAAVMSSEKTTINFLEFRAIVGLLSEGSALGRGNASGKDAHGHGLSRGKSRDLVAQRSYLMNGMLTEDQAILDFLVALDSHQKKCERDGKYIEARMTAKRLQELKTHEEEKRKREMKARQQDELSDAEQTYMQELEEHRRIWDEKEKKVATQVQEQMASLEASHKQILEAFRNECGERAPRRPQYSKQLLNQRKVQDYLGRQAKHLEAEHVKRMTDKMEDAEMCATLASYDAEVNLKEQQLRMKLQQEVDASTQRAARGRDEMARAREQDLERRTQRFKNMTKELQSIQRLESIQLEGFLGQQTLAGKRQVPAGGK